MTMPKADIALNKMTSPPLDFRHLEIRVSLNPSVSRNRMCGSVL